MIHGFRLVAKSARKRFFFRRLTGQNYISVKIYSRDIIAHSWFHSRPFLAWFRARWLNGNRDGATTAAAKFCQRSDCVAQPSPSCTTEIREMKHHPFPNGPISSRGLNLPFLAIPRCDRAPRSSVTDFTMQIISIYKRGKLDKLALHFLRYYSSSVYPCNNLR